jgi:hypothetical protein
MIKKFYFSMLNFIASPLIKELKREVADARKELSYESSPAVLRYHVKSSDLLQIDLASNLNVTPAAISKAIDQEAGLESLRRKIIDLIKTRKITVQ